MFFATIIYQNKSMRYFYQKKKIYGGHIFVFKTKPLPFQGTKAFMFGIFNGLATLWSKLQYKDQRKNQRT